MQDEELAATASKEGDSAGTSILENAEDAGREAVNVVEDGGRGSFSRLLRVRDFGSRLFRDGENTIFT